MTLIRPGALSRIAHRILHGVQTPSDTAPCLSPVPFRPFPTSRFCSFELPARPSRHSRESYAIWSPANISIGSEQRNRAKGKRERRQKFRSAGIFLEFARAHFRRRLNFPARVENFERNDARATAHFFAPLSPPLPLNRIPVAMNRFF